jgi:hypothetical protein
MRSVARSDAAQSKGRIQKRKTNRLQIIKSSLQGKAGPYKGPSPEVSRFIDHFVGGFFLDKASRLYNQKARLFPSSSSHIMAPIVI